MKREPEATRALERSLAVVCRNLFREPSELLGVGRFELLRTLGSGGMGVVYEALDGERGEHVALKMLKREGASDQLRLKREFRALAQLRHPNLVALRELSVNSEHTFFTMELVHGTDILSYVMRAAQQGPLDAALLRRLMLGLASGVLALHEAGKLHGDLKPSNVLVSDDERVVLLDFGLVRDAFEPSMAVEGTPLYMAPERYQGVGCEASDWYSVGRILAQLLRAATRRAQAPVDEPELAELAQLAEQLQRRAPRARARADQILRVLRARNSEPRARRPAPPAPSFVGRSAELAALGQAFARSASGPVLALVRGEAGIGKTALMAEFIRSVRAKAPVLVLHGRCYEREFVPFKAFDGAIDELSRYLASAARDYLKPLTEPERRALMQLFPALGHVHTPRSAAQAGEAPHPVIMRNRGFDAFKKLLRVLAEERPLLFCVDNLQWSDTDSGALLSALLCEDDGPPLLVVASDRMPRGSLNPALLELNRAAEIATRTADTLELHLAPLARTEALALADQLLERAAGARRRIAEESRGNPLFLVELSRWVCATERDDEGLWTRPSALSIDAIVASRVEALSLDARRGLFLIALSGRPLSAEVWSRALNLGSKHFSVLAELTHARLIHVLLAHGSARAELAHTATQELLEVEHDRIGEAILRRVPADERRELHARLARTLDNDDELASEASLVQYIAAGLAEEAARRARSAGELALSALAFSRAAWLFERALEHGSWPASEAAHIYGALALSFEHAGLGLEAAAAYLNAARLTENVYESVLLEARAGEHLMHNGRYAEGLVSLQRCYERLGFAWPKGTLALTLRTLYMLLLLHLGRAKSHASESPSALHLARVKLLSFVGMSLEGFDAVRALYNALLIVNEASQSPDSMLRTRALGLRGLLRSVGLLRGGTRRGLEELESAWTTADRLGDLSERTDLRRQIAAAHYLHGDPRAALLSAERCEADLRLLPLPPRDLHRVMGVIGCALWDLGELREARRRWTSFSREAHHQRDVMTSFWIHAHPAQLVLLMASDDEPGARAMLERQQRLCALHPQYKFLSWSRAFCLGERELYWGDPGAALGVVDAHWGQLANVGYTIFDLCSEALRARAAQAAAALLEAGPERERLLRRAEGITRRARFRYRNRVGVAATAMLAASNAVLRGRRQVALKQLDLAIGMLEQSNKVLAASAGFCKGSLLGAAQGMRLRASAERVLTEQDIVAPVHWVRWALPGFRAVLESDV